MIVTCCGKESKWVTLSPRVSYWYCSECKQEVTPKDETPSASIYNEDKDFLEFYGQLEDDVYEEHIKVYQQLIQKELDKVHDNIIVDDIGTLEKRVGIVKEEELLELFDQPIPYRLPDEFYSANDLADILRKELAKTPTFVQESDGTYTN